MNATNLLNNCNGATGATGATPQTGASFAQDDIGQRGIFGNKIDKKKATLISVGIGLASFLVGTIIGNKLIKKRR